MVSESVSIRVKARVGNFLLDIDFTCASGLIVLFGPSGCGKSSLLNCLAGLRRVEEGVININGKSLIDTRSGINLSPQERHVAYMFQDPSLFPHMTVEENIRFGIKRWPEQEKSERVRELMQSLKLEGLNGRRTGQLSGGQMQRAALARALAPRPELILLDEPLSALDGALRNELAEELKSLQKSLAVPMIFVTHSKAESLQLADSVVLLEAGKVKAIGKAHEIFLEANNNISPGARFSF